MKAVLRLFVFGVIPTTLAFAASTVPVGGMSISLASGTVSVPSTTSFSIPLLDIPTISGPVVAKISSLTTTGVTVTGAGWTSGALATLAAPYSFRITSGTAVGTTFGIIANTADTLTTGVDMAALGIVIGDSFRIIPVDTLNTLFGSSTLLGGTSPANADTVILSSSIQTAYYYNTSLSRWVRTSGPTSDRGNVPIPQDSEVTIIRKSTAMTLRFIGRVPDTRFVYSVANAGSTYTHTGFPTDVTLGALSMQTALPGWVSNASAASADALIVDLGVTTLAYFHNGTYWQRTSGPATNRDSVIISAGTPIILYKRGTASGSANFTRNLPYSF